MEKYYYVSGKVEYIDDEGDLSSETYEFIKTSDVELNYLDIIKLIITKFKEDGYNELILNINTDWYETDGLAML